MLQPGKIKRNIRRDFGTGRAVGREEQAAGSCSGGAGGGDAPGGGPIRRGWFRGNGAAPGRWLAPGLLVGGVFFCPEPPKPSSQGEQRH